jgi:hypothetical protein
MIVWLKAEAESARAESRGGTEAKSPLDAYDPPMIMWCRPSKHGVLKSS